MSTAAPATPSISALDAAQMAVAHTRVRLFPFRFERWLALGFVACLDQCGRRAGFGFNFPGGRSGDADMPGAARVVEWLAAHVLLVAAIAGLALAAIVVAACVVLYVNSRGVFMYIDVVATGRAEVARPWREHAERAGSYFGWMFGLAMASLLGVLLIVAGGAAVAMTAVGQGGLGAPGIVVLVTLALAVVALLVLASLASLVLRDFAAPIQLATGLPCAGALRVFAGLVGARPGTFGVYLLLKLAFALALGMVMLMGACLTCCCALLPVLCQTLFQPAFFFERAWSLYLLRQMGVDVLGPCAVGPADAAPAV
jgi:hypothetical protein